MCYKFLALGDSYTIGEGVEPAERWPTQLAGMLRERGIDIGEPETVATTGWTTDELAAAMAERRLRGPFDLVSLLIGVNNQYRGWPLEEYRDQFRGLLGQAVALAGGEAGRVLVLSIPDWGATPFAEGRDRGRIASEIDAFNAANRQEAVAAGAWYVDVTPVSRKAAADPTMVAGDDLHPSGVMYREWAHLALPGALGALGRG
jgi:lysophospholipase L1-like esterase